MCNCPDTSLLTARQPCQLGSSPKLRNVNYISRFFTSTPSCQVLSQQPMIIVKTKGLGFCHVLSRRPDPPPKKRDVILASSLMCISYIQSHKYTSALLFDFVFRYATVPWLVERYCAVDNFE